MKTLLMYKAERLFSQEKCPICASHKVAHYRGEELFDPPMVMPLPYPPPHEGVKANVKFYCGAEFSIDADDKIIASKPCSLSATREADDMDIDAHARFEIRDKQEQAA